VYVLTSTNIVLFSRISNDIKVERSAMAVIGVDCFFAVSTKKCNGGCNKTVPTVADPGYAPDHAPDHQLEKVI